MITWGKCPSCSEGDVGYRRCGPETVLLLCENCALVWMHPSKVDQEHANDPLTPEFGRRHPGVDLRTSRWATEQDVNNWGWGAYLLRPQDLLANPDQN